MGNAHQAAWVSYWWQGEVVLRASGMAGKRCGKGSAALALHQRTEQQQVPCGCSSLVPGPYPYLYKRRPSRAGAPLRLLPPLRPLPPLLCPRPRLRPTATGLCCRCRVLAALRAAQAAIRTDAVVVTAGCLESLHCAVNLPLAHVGVLRAAQRASRSCRSAWAGAPTLPARCGEGRTGAPASLRHHCSPLVVCPVPPAHQAPHTRAVDALCR